MVPERVRRVNGFGDNSKAIAWHCLSLMLCHCVVRSLLEQFIVFFQSYPSAIIKIIMYDFSLTSDNYTHRNEASDLLYHTKLFSAVLQWGLRSLSVTCLDRVPINAGGRGWERWELQRLVCQFVSSVEESYNSESRSEGMIWTPNQASRPLSRIGQLLSSLARHTHKTHHWKEQTKISKCTNCQSHSPKYREAPSIWKLRLL